MAEKRWCFAHDKESKFYLIPANLKGRFVRYLRSNDSESLKDEFGDYTINGYLSDYTFMNPKGPRDGDFDEI